MADFFVQLIHAAYEPTTRMRPRPVAHFEQTPATASFNLNPAGSMPTRASTETEIQPVWRTPGRSSATQSVSPPASNGFSVREGRVSQKDERVGAPSPAHIHASIAHVDHDHGRSRRMTSSPAAEIPKPDAFVDPPTSEISPAALSQKALHAHSHTEREADIFGSRSLSALSTSESQGRSPEQFRLHPDVRLSSTPLHATLTAQTVTASGERDDSRRLLALRPQDAGGEMQPLAFPETPRTTAQQVGPVIRVTIGRIVVKAEVRSVPNNARPRQTQTSAPSLSLDEYLNARNGLSTRNGGGA
ncbi:MAG: hypothetical protein NZ553_15515 [Caldilinea sp.]|nr:hypothetical protein [Caldilinea sp.]MDW8441883.1 hypothetical protein [Caldilineaceae bacterium]